MIQGEIQDGEQFERRFNPHPPDERSCARKCLFICV